jgi:4-hydroxy-4-methyl-2-oxoglutarate aldolase
MRLAGALLIPLAAHCQLPELKSSSVSEAVEQLTGRRAHMSGDIRLIAGVRMSGPAVTLRLMRDEKASATEAGLAAIRLIEGAPKGSVVVAALDAEKDVAVFGSTFAALARTRNLAGFLVDGAVRDLSDLKRIALPVFARGLAPGSAGGHYRVEAVNVAVRCGGIEVEPGDFIFGDEDGVSLAPRARFAEIAPAARKFESDKQALLPLIEKHGSYLKAMQERNAIQRR